MDFEASFWRAVDHICPDVVKKGCFFHYAQAVWRKIQELGSIMGGPIAECISWSVILAVVMGSAALSAAVNDRDISSPDQVDTIKDDSTMDGDIVANPGDLSSAHWRSLATGKQDLTRLDCNSADSCEPPGCYACHLADHLEEPVDVIDASDIPTLVRQLGLILRAIARAIARRAKSWIDELLRQWLPEIVCYVLLDINVDLLTILLLFVTGKQLWGYWSPLRQSPQLWESTIDTCSESTRNEQFLLVKLSAIVTGLPTEILCKIFTFVVMKSARDDDVDFETVLTTLGDVSRRWKEIVEDPTFRREVLRELFARDPFQRYTKSPASNPFQIGLDGSYLFPRCVTNCSAVLGDELFVVLCGYEITGIDVYDATETTTVASPPSEVCRQNHDEIDRVWQYRWLNEVYNQRDHYVPLRRNLLTQRLSELRQTPSFESHENLRLRRHMTVFGRELKILDVAASEHNRSIYIFEHDTNRWVLFVLRVAATDGRILSQWTVDIIGDYKTIYKASTAVSSLTGHVIIWIYNMCTLFHYDADGRLLRNFKVCVDHLDIVWLRAFQTSTGGYAVTYEGRNVEDDNCPHFLYVGKITGDGATAQIESAVCVDSGRMRCSASTVDATGCVITVVSVDTDQPEGSSTYQSGVYVDIFDATQKRRRRIDLTGRLPEPSFFIDFRRLTLDQSRGRLFVCTDADKHIGNENTHEVVCVDLWRREARPVSP